MYDDGKSAGEIRKFFNMLGPSDIRKVQQLIFQRAARFWIKWWLFEYRFPSNIPSNVIRSKLTKKFHLRNTPFINGFRIQCLNQVKFFKSFISNLELIEKGSSRKQFLRLFTKNCIYAGTFIFYKRNIELASLEIEKLFNLTGSVLPTSLENKNLLEWEGMERCYILGRNRWLDLTLASMKFLLDDYPKKSTLRISLPAKKAYLQNHETCIESSSRSKFAIKSVT